MLTTLTLLVGLGQPPVALPSDALQPAFVSADARWVAHVDVESALASTLLQALMELEADVDFDSPEWDEVREKLDLDPLQDIAAVTAYGTSDDPEDAVVLIRTNARIDNALSRLHEWLDERSLQVGDISVSHWEEKGGGSDEIYTYVASRPGSDERLLAVSPEAGQLARAVQVLRGNAPSMAQRGADLRLDPRPGTIVYVAAPEGLSRFLDDDAPQVARLATSVDVQLGENAGRVFIELELQTDDAQAVQQVSQILQGASALASLLSQDEPEIQPFLPVLSGLRFEAAGRSLKVLFEHDAQGLVDLVRSAGHHPDPEAAPEEPPTGAARMRPPQRRGDGWH